MFTLPTDLIERIEAIAQSENRSPVDVVETMLQAYEKEAVQGDDTPPGSLAALARSALEANLGSEYTDSDERSREILKQEYPDYIRRRMNEGDNA